MKAAVRTDIGNVRENNEDCAFADPELGLFIVADGVGGQLGGEVASSIATEIITSVLKAELSNRDRFREPADLIREAIRTAHEAIWARAGENPAWRGMATTVVVALRQGERLHIAHLGDSRAYLVQGHAMRQLTDDHSVVAEMAKAGVVVPAISARRQRLSHLITRCLGSPDSAEPELQWVDWERGNFLLLCSDGLTDMVDDEEIEAVIVSGGASLEATCERLIEIAKAHGGKDNITVILAHNA
jgi:PPM family protein phosphatase